MRHPELKKLSNEEIMDMYGFSYKESSPKYRYVMLRGSKHEIRQNLIKIKDKIQSYPKRLL